MGGIEGGGGGAMGGKAGAGGGRGVWNGKFVPTITARGSIAALPKPRLGGQRRSSDGREPAESRWHLASLGAWGVPIDTSAMPTPLHCCIGRGTPGPLKDNSMTDGSPRTRSCVPETTPIG